MRLCPVVLDPASAQLLLFGLSTGVLSRGCRLLLSVQPGLSHPHSLAVIHASHQQRARSSAISASQTHQGLLGTWYDGPDSAESQAKHFPRLASETLVVPHALQSQLS